MWPNFKWSQPQERCRPTFSPSFASWHVPNFHSFKDLLISIYRHRMDLEYGQQVWDHIMNDPAYDSLDGELDYADPRALFEHLGGPPPSFPTPQEVRSKARVLSEKVLDNWKLLSNITERYEATIQKRWIKKTKEQRKKILIGAWPKMSLSHRPDFAAFKTKPAGQTGDSRREAYMWPYINLEDLLKSKVLFLLLLNSRGRNKPNAFAQADFDACRFGRVTSALVPAFLNEHVMIFTGRDTPETYGELIAWSDHPKPSIGSHHIAEPFLEKDFLSSRFRSACIYFLLIAAKPSSMTFRKRHWQIQPFQLHRNLPPYQAMKLAWLRLLQLLRKLHIVCQQT